MVKKLPANVGYIRDSDSTSGSKRSPGGRHGNPLLPGEFHGQRSLESYSPESQRVGYDQSDLACIHA